MFRLDVLQAQELVLALAIGLFLVLMLVLLYHALWRFRPGGAATPARQRVAWFMPAFLALLYLGVLGFAVIYTFYRVRHPPNW